ncbi:hypothetical protein WMY93_015340 [Mugilogobius chulae]|uniref:Uncharacterized protein n=1 Tax=Mugilogobius chulae TaxID=88201 RepID=A0AAW0P1Z4_9GOBI
MSESEKEREKRVRGSKKEREKGRRKRREGGEREKKEEQEKERERERRRGKRWRKGEGEERERARKERSDRREGGKRRKRKEGRIGRAAVREGPLQQQEFYTLKEGFESRSGYHTFVTKKLYETYLKAPHRKGERRRPIAVGGQDVVVQPGEVVFLNGSESQAIGDDIESYSWSLEQGDPRVSMELAKC